MARRVLARVDRVRRADDQRARRLAEDLGQPRHRHAPAGQQVAEHAARADRRELVGVADEQHVRAVADGREQCAGQAQVEHRGLVDDQEVRLDRVGRPARRALAGHPLEQTVDRRRLRARALRQPPRGLPGRRAQPHPPPVRAQHVDQRAHHRRLAGARPARQYRQPPRDRQLDRRPLVVGRHERAALRPTQPTDIKHRRRVHQSRDPLRQPRLGAMQRRVDDQVVLNDDLTRRRKLIDRILNVRAQQPPRPRRQLVPRQRTVPVGLRLA